jgi:hypothetical protein
MAVPQVYGRSLGACDFHSLARAFAALGELRLVQTSDGPRQQRCDGDRGSRGSDARSGGSGGREDGGGGGSDDGGCGGPGLRVLWGIREDSLPADLTVADLPLGPNTRVVSWWVVSGARAAGAMHGRPPQEPCARPQAKPCVAAHARAVAAGRRPVAAIPPRVQSVYTAHCYQALLPCALAAAIGHFQTPPSRYPDNDVLSHPNTHAFVSHMGLHSLYGGARALARDRIF